MTMTKYDLLQFRQINAQPTGTIVFAYDNVTGAPWCKLVDPANHAGAFKFVQLRADDLEQRDRDPVGDS